LVRAWCGWLGLGQGPLGRDPPYVAGGQQSRSVEECVNGDINRLGGCPMPSGLRAHLPRAFRRRDWDLSLAVRDQMIARRYGDCEAGPQQSASGQRVAESRAIQFTRSSNKYPKE